MRSSEDPIEKSYVYVEYGICEIVRCEHHALSGIITKSNFARQEWATRSKTLLSPSQTVFPNGNEAYDRKIT